MNQVLLAAQNFVVTIRQISTNPAHSQTICNRRDPRDLYLTRWQFQGEQHQEALQSMPRLGFYRKEVGGHDQIPMARQKLLPTGLLFPLRRQFDAVSLENAGNRAAGHLVPQIR
jgi:hypothetical protein